jgi:hypothetical protein
VDDDHADSVVTLAEEAKAELAVPRIADWLDRLEVEPDRICDALGWFLEP